MGVGAGFELQGRTLVWRGCSWILLLQGLAVASESSLVQLAKSILDATEAKDALEHDIIDAWLCRTIYLRLSADDALEAWLASGITTRLIEAASIRCQRKRASIAGPLPDSPLEKPSEQPVRLVKQVAQSLVRPFAITQHLYTWISYELDLTYFTCLETPTEYPRYASTQCDHTHKLLALLPMALSLARDQDETALRRSLSNVVHETDKEPRLIITQCSLALYILRRLWAQGSLRKANDELLKIALDFLARGLDAVRRMAENDCPWHHVASLPFHTMCILLAIDTEASLSLILAAMETFQVVARLYQTSSMKEALEIIRILLYLHHKWRSVDVSILSQALTMCQSTSKTSSDSPYRSLYDQLDNEKSATIMGCLADFPNLQNMNIADILPGLM